MKIIIKKSVQVKIDHSWQEVLQDVFATPFFRDLAERVRREYKHHCIYPPASQIFSAFNITPFHLVKAVLLGQDPYHNARQAHGLSFSVLPPQPPPPSLINIFKAITHDLHIPMPEKHGDLSYWAKQGVFLLNSVLSVQAHRAASHQHIGWQQFTDEVIRVLSERKSNVVFLLWGRLAQSKAHLIDESKHLILRTSHPSPLSAHKGFLQCRHFSQTNAYLQAHNIPPIDWRIPLTY